MACAKPQVPASLSTVNQACNCGCFLRVEYTANHRFNTFCAGGKDQILGAVSNQSEVLITWGKNAISGCACVLKSLGRYCSSAARKPVTGPAVLNTTKGRWPVCTAHCQIPFAKASKAVLLGGTCHA